MTVNSSIYLSLRVLRAGPGPSSSVGSRLSVLLRSPVQTQCRGASPGGKPHPGAAGCPAAHRRDTFPHGRAPSVFRPGFVFGSAACGSPSQPFPTVLFTSLAFSPGVWFKNKLAGVTDQISERPLSREGTPPKWGVSLRPRPREPPPPTAPVWTQQGAASVDQERGVLTRLQLLRHLDLGLQAPER